VAPKNFSSNAAAYSKPGREKPRIGIRWNTSGKDVLSHPDPVEQVYHSITRHYRRSGAVASPNSDVKLST